MNESEPLRDTEVSLPGTELLLQRQGPNFKLLRRLNLRVTLL